jgi:hypothetical protein
VDFLLHDLKDRVLSLDAVFVTGPYELKRDATSRVSMGSPVLLPTDAAVMDPAAVATSALKGPSLPELPAALTTMTPLAIAFSMTGLNTLCIQKGDTICHLAIDLSHVCHVVQAHMHVYAFMLGHIVLLQSAA